MHEALVIFFPDDRSDSFIYTHKLYWVYKHSFHFQFAAVSELDMYDHLRTMKTITSAQGSYKVV